MDISDLVQHVRTEHDHQPSVEDQVRVIDIVVWHGYQQDEPLTQSEIEALAADEGVEFDCRDARPALDNLVDLDLISRSSPSDDRTYVVSERRDEIVNGRFEAVVAHDREALIDHIQDADSTDTGDESAVADGGPTPRTVVADALGIAPADVEARLRAGELVDHRERVNTAIDAIADHDDLEVRPDYGKVVLRRPGYRYRLDETATQYIDH